MRVERTLVGILFLVAAASGGCGGQLAYNLPPATRLMEPGPGVGGPGPGVIPPAGNPYGLYGGAVGRFGDGGAGTYMGGYGDGVPCGPYAANNAAQPMGAPRAMVPPRAMGVPRGNAIAATATSDVVQASYSCGCGGACGCGGGCGGACGCGDDGYAGDCGCGGNCGGECSCGPGCGCGGGCGSGCCCLNEFCNDCHAFVGSCAQCGCAPGQCLCATLGGALHGILDGHHGHMRPGSMEACADGGAIRRNGHFADRVPRRRRRPSLLGRQRLRHVRFRAAGDSRPTGLLPRRDLSPAS